MSHGQPNRRILLHVYKKKTNSLSLAEVANNFNEPSDHLFFIFGKLFEFDLQANLFL